MLKYIKSDFNILIRNIKMIINGQSIFLPNLNLYYIY